MTHTGTMALLTATLPVGVDREYCGETLTVRSSTCSSPKVTFAAESLRDVFESAYATLRFCFTELEPRTFLLPP